MRISAGAWRRCMRAAQPPPQPAAGHLRAAHAVFVVHGLHRDTYALSRLVLLATTSSALTSDPVAASRFLSYAAVLFRRAESPVNSFIYNALIRAFAQGPDPKAALFYFRLMLEHQRRPCPPRRHDQGEGGASTAVAPDHLTFPFVLRACTTLESYSPGQQVHALVCKDGLAMADHYIQTALLRFYAKFMGDLIGDADRLFDEIPTRDAVHWDVLMSAYLRRDQPSESLRLFRLLVAAGVEPDEFVFTTALAACAHAGALDEGVRIHEYIEKKGGPALVADAHICTTLVSMYAKCGCIDKAVKVFDGMPRRSSFLWAAMIGGFAMHGCAKEAIGCLRRMQEEDGLRPDGVALLGALAACSHAGLVEEGRLLLGRMQAHYGVAPRHEHYSCAVDLLCRVGLLEEAVELIRSMPMRPLASVWGSLLSGCRTYKNVDFAELAVGELLKIEGEVGGGAADGAHVQLWGIYMKANRPDDAGRARKWVDGRGIKKTPGCSVIELEGTANSFVSGDQAHPLRTMIYETLDIFAEHVIEEQKLASLGMLSKDRCTRSVV